MMQIKQAGGEFAAMKGVGKSLKKANSGRTPCHGTVK
jgi:hypothetical protein